MVTAKLPSRRAAAALACVLTLNLGAAGPAAAAGTALPDPDQLVRRLEQTLADPDAHRAALRAGAERVSFCTYCHGKDGNSLKPEVPKLAGQNAKYLFNQFERFADGRRKNFVMQELAGNLSAEDRINIAIYFASLPVHAEPPDDPTLVVAGRLTYERVCVICHGPGALGKDEYPRLAGQMRAYVERTLVAFRSDESKHVDPTMRQIAQSLSDVEVAAVSTYISSLP